MNYIMRTSSEKNKEEVKIVISPSNSLEREFFTNLFNGNLAGVTIERQAGPTSDEITIIRRDETEKKGIGLEDNN